jgi:cytochrome oxidase Cu insertion factor (SCO1/SenC/PrrC family)
VALSLGAAAVPQMSEHSSQADHRAVARGAGRLRLRVALPVLVAAAAVGIAAGAALTLFGRSSPAKGSNDTGSSSTAGAAVETWGAGARPAPAFALRDQNGHPVSLAALHGKPAIITFLDPLCRNVCPLEAQVLNRAVAALPAGERPQVIAISVNRWGNARADLVEDVHRWRLGANWRWAVGDSAALAATWQRYGIGVQVTTQTIAGVKVHEITHTLASFLVDGSGHERALFVWPFAEPELERAIAAVHS